MAAFPIDIACVMAEGFSEGLPIKSKYLGNRTFTNKAIVTLTISIEDNANMHMFTGWHKAQGNEVFTIELPLYGRLKTWNAKIVNNLTTDTMVDTDIARKIIMEIEVQDIIYGALSAPTNFTASDDQIDQITFSWDGSAVGVEPITYDIYEDGVSILTDVTSPFIYAVEQKIAEYKVVASNIHGTAESVTDEGVACVDVEKLNLGGGGTYLHLARENNSYFDFGLDESKYRISVNGIEQTPQDSGLDVSWLILDPIANEGQTVTLTLLERDSYILPFTDRAVNNDSLIVSVSPIYLMTEDLIDWGGFNWLVDSANNENTPYNGKLEYVGDGTEAEGAPFIPTATDYIKEGWINLAEIGDGKGTKRINTGWIASSTDEWSMSCIYNLMVGTSYDAYTIHYLGDNTCDIYLWSSTQSVSDTPTYSNVDYTPPVTNWKITEDAPDIITPNSVIYDMATFITPNSVIYDMATFNTI